MDGYDPVAQLAGRWVFLNWASHSCSSTLFREEQNLGPGSRALPGPGLCQIAGKQMFHLLNGAELVDCCPYHAGREGIATNVAAYRDVSSICEAGEAKETGDEERGIRWLAPRSLDVRR